MTKTSTIPIIHMFNNNYVIPASVSFYSLLKNADKKYNYELFVLHSDITNENQQKLRDIVSEFKNAKLNFIFMNNKFNDLNLATKNSDRYHYTKEMFYKFLMPSLFPQYDKCIVTDVDVVFCGDISREFIEFNTAEEIYLAGCKSVTKQNSFSGYKEKYLKDFSIEEYNSLVISAGYLIYNLSRMRKDNIENKLIEYAMENSRRLIQPEQDVLNLVCYPKTKLLSKNAMVCNYSYDFFKTNEDYNNARYFSADEVKEILANPIQLHYAGNQKPWNMPSCTKSRIWYEYLVKTPFFYDVMKTLIFNENNLKINSKYKKYKNLFNFSIIISVILFISLIIEYIVFSNY